MNKKVLKKVLKKYVKLYMSATKKSNQGLDDQGISDLKKFITGILYINTGNTFDESEEKTYKQLKAVYSQYLDKRVLANVINMLKKELGQDFETPSPLIIKLKKEKGEKSTKKLVTNEDEKKKKKKKHKDSFQKNLDDLNQFFQNPLRGLLRKPSRPLMC